MPYARRAPKVDIRNLHIQTKQGPTPEPKRPQPSDDAKTAPASSVWHNPASELRAIAWCGIPLILLIIVASIFDHQKGWVIPLAEWLMSR